MEPEDYAILGLTPPSPNHNVFHGYVNMDGTFTVKGEAWQRFADAMYAEKERIRRGAL